ncbi:cyclase family protein [Anaerobium acetethylicum]|uniref:Kynurenine formamidase n=1 Tax=Anaerobium acetethylicum TaxID=1619234 RepID=A0A1D3TYF7_9FIRM|nr:cyclase family protein [Anaerobium acetethylicum]SCP99470.1 Kynurenine formamidase [Anaerobium acetethylicum]
MESGKWKMLDEYLKNAKVVDLSPTLERGMPKFPTHPQIVIDQSITHEHDGYYCQTINMGEHSGAHVDAPAHMLPEKMNQTVDSFPANMLFGPAIKYDLFRVGAVAGERITKEDILRLEEEMGDAAKEGDIVLLDFGWMKYWSCDSGWKNYAMDEPGLSEDAVALFADRKVKAVGSDTIACDTPMINGKEDFSYGHKKYWLPNGIFIMEMIANMDQLPTRSYFMAIPLKIKNGSGSPIRPLAIID